MVRFRIFDSVPPRMGTVPGPDRIELLQLSGERPERLDAARNRKAILDAAQRLLRDRGAGSITMDRLAAEAGVGKGTLFRRFGDRAGLFHALLDETERSLQEAFIRGPAPLGPGAPPVQRLVAFGQELLRMTQERGDLLLAAQPSSPGLRYHSGVHSAYRAHISSLLDELTAPDATYLADVLLAALAPELVLHQLEQGTRLSDLCRLWEQLVRRLVPDGKRRPGRSPRSSRASSASAPVATSERPV
jgi:AcrR family transcriptional regulator